MTASPLHCANVTLDRLSVTVERESVTLELEARPNYSDCGLMTSSPYVLVTLRLCQDCARAGGRGGIRNEMASGGKRSSAQ